MKKILLITYFCFLLPSITFADTSSYEDMVNSISRDEGLSRAEVDKITRAIFSEIISRMKEDKSTSIPNLGRFYSQEKQLEEDHNFSGGLGRVIRVPRFTFSPELKKKLKGK